MKFATKLTLGMLLHYLWKLKILEIGKDLTKLQTVKRWELF